MALNFKFFSFKDLIFSVVPTAASYEGYLQDLMPLEALSNRFVELGIGMVLSLVFALVFYRDNVLSYKRSLAEILATGYFMNFTGPLGRMLKGKAPLTFIFPDNQEYEVVPQHIQVKVVLPTTMSALRKHSNAVGRDGEIAYIKEHTASEPFWVRAEKKADSNLLIHEYPRTLFALPAYLKKDFSDAKKAEKHSRKLFKHFNSKIENYRATHSQDIPDERFVFDYI